MVELAKSPEGASDPQLSKNYQLVLALSLNQKYINTTAICFLQNNKIRHESLAEVIAVSINIT